MEIKCTEEEKENIISAFANHALSCPFTECGRFDCDDCMRNNIKWIIIDEPTIPIDNHNKLYDDLLAEMKRRYQEYKEHMEHEVERLEQEIKEEKERIGEDVYNQRILSALKGKYQGGW